ncbi:MAG: hypothetical protein AAB594_01525 [Patescibacteria group bacterium]
MSEKNDNANAKPKVNNIASVGIIYRESNPAEIFLEEKDGGYPVKLFQNCLCPIGGNWIGEIAKSDKNTFSTFRREIEEELSLSNGAASNLELNLLGIISKEKEHLVSHGQRKPEARDAESLSKVKEEIKKLAAAFGDFMISVPKSLLDQADPKNKLNGLSSLVSYWLVPLSEESWQTLKALQKKYSNLSNESQTRITALDEIVKTKKRIAFGHDRAFQKFFLSRGLNDANKMPIVSDIGVEEIGQPLDSYQEYLVGFEISKKPL